MRVPRLFVEDTPPEQGPYLLRGNAHRHAVQALRLRKGAEVLLFDGSGREFAGVLREPRRDETEMEILAVSSVDREAPLRWELVQAISRGERMDYTLQKSVELGVAAIHPVNSQRSVVKLDAKRADKRLEHWRGVVVSACEQSGRTRVPEVHEVSPLHEFLERPAEGMLVFLDPEGTQSLRDLPAEPPQLVRLLAGPEGGFDAGERQRILAAGATGLRLGPRILRTETAALVAAALLLGRWGDLG